MISSSLSPEPVAVAYVLLELITVCEGAFFVSIFDDIFIKHLIECTCTNFLCYLCTIRPTVFFIFFIFTCSAVRCCSDVSKNRFDLDSTIGQIFGDAK